MGLVDLESHFVFYGAYHSNSVNKIIHFVFVWPILFTALLLLNYEAPTALTSVPIPLLSAPHFFSVTPSLLVAVIYAVFYLLLEPKAGSVAALLVLFCWAAAQWVFAWLGPEVSWKVSLMATPCLEERRLEPRMRMRTMP